MGQFRLSSYLPTVLPTDGKTFDLAIAFSVFTHTSPRATRAALDALRQTVRTHGLLVLTVRPVEFLYDACFNDKENFSRAEMLTEYSTRQFAYWPGGLTVLDGDDVYGDAVIDPNWFERYAAGWTLESIDRGIDLHQTILILRAT